MPSPALGGWCFVGVELGDSHSCTRSIIVRELCKGEESKPIVLLVVTVDLDVLFQGLISVLGLPITFWMVSRGEVQIHVQGHVK